jgi:hypothetical protein
MRGSVNRSFQVVRRPRANAAARGC